METAIKAPDLQPDLTARFARLINRGRLAHAYLLVGPAGSGKRALADWVALRLFCQHVQDGEPDGTCAECQRILSGNHPDVVVAAPTGRTIKVDQLRHLKAEFTRRGVEGQAKVFIIDGADRLTPGAANSLLKFIEEPGAGIYIFLLATNKMAVLPTLQSRSQVVELRPLSSVAREAQLKAAGVPADLLELAEALVLDPQQLPQLVADQWLQASAVAVASWVQKVAAGNPLAFVDVQVDLVKLAPDREHQLVLLDLIALGWRDLLRYQYQQPVPAWPVANWPATLARITAHLSRPQVVKICTLTLAGRQLMAENISFQNVVEQLTLRILAITGPAAN